MKLRKINLSLAIARTYHKLTRFDNRKLKDLSINDFYKLIKLNKIPSKKSQEKQ